MKKKLSFIALAFALFAIVAISALMFSGCDTFLEWLNEDSGDPNNGNNGNNNENRNETEKTIDKILQEFYDKHQYRGGISLAITRNEKLVYSGAVGYADRNNTVKLTPQHRMRLASVSKPITSIAISKLFEEGKLSFNDNVFGTNGIFKNAYGMPTYNGIPVDMTVMHLLNHESGFGTDAPNNFDIETALQTPLQNLPGAEYEYSNFGYNVLGRVIEEVTGMPYEKYVQEHVLKLCGINGMRIGANAPGPDEVEYIRNDNSTALYGIAPGPSGGWVASPIELMKFMAHIDNFPNVKDILKSDTPRTRALGHSGRLGQGTWTYLMRESNGFNWTLLMNYVPPDFENIDRPALFKQIRDAITVWPEGADLSGISGGDTSSVKTPNHDFYFGILSYRSATGNIEVVVNEDFTLNQLINIEAPWTAGATLTIRSTNPSQPVTITRGGSGNLFTIADGATLIFKDIIIDGGKNGAFAESGGGSLVRVNGGSLIMNTGAVLRNNANLEANANGGAVHVSGTGAFTMNSGEISGNTAANTGGGVINFAPTTFTMNSGKIIGNTSVNTGGGVITTGTFTMTGGEISGNNASGGNGVRISGTAVFNQFGGVVAGTGGNVNTVVSNNSEGIHNTSGAPNNAVIIAWNRPSGTLNYTVGSSTNLTVSPDNATAVWANQSGVSSGAVLGISYANGSNTGWIKAW